MDLLDRLLGHDEWTTERLIDFCRQVDDAQLDQEFDIGHRTIRATLDHFVNNTEYWLSAMDGRPFAIDPDGGSLDEILARHRRFYPPFAARARALQAGNRLDETFIDHWKYPQSYGATIVQVTVHNAIHRSEVLHILQRLGVTDLPDGDVQEWEHITGKIAIGGE